MLLVVYLFKSTQEAYRKCSLCCSVYWWGGEETHPVPMEGGTPIQFWCGISQSRPNGGTPIQSDGGKLGYPHQPDGGTPIGKMGYSPVGQMGVPPVSQMGVCPL